MLRSLNWELPKFELGNLACSQLICSSMIWMIENTRTDNVHKT